MEKHISIEICINCDTLQDLTASAQAAHDGGASTIELCSAMDQDGLTPSIAHITAARSVFTRSGLMAMIRPRGGDFVYTPQEVGLMKQQIGQAARAGADGVVFGALRDDGEIALGISAELITLSYAHGLATTFHRAFDATPDCSRSLQQLIELGADRVLTSGTAWGSGQPAAQGIAQLKQTIAQASDKIEVVIGGGITPASASPLLNELTPLTSQIALHAYSGVLENGLTNARKVAALVEVLNSYT